MYLYRGATAIAQVEHKYITVQAHSQAYDANELWHFPRQIIIPSHSLLADVIITAQIRQKLLGYVASGYYYRLARWYH